MDKIKPNPYQPRREFDEGKLKELSDSIRQYGVLQPLVVTRKEVAREDGGIASEYELIAGERRLRASKLAGVSQVPVVIRTGSVEENARMKLELALIENIQREDLNPVDRARAFKQLAEEFAFKHTHIAQRVGKSREYVSNSIRLLSLPEEMIAALNEGKMSEGHTRPLLMLCERPEEQMTLFKDIVLRRITVRDAERIARHTATEKVRKWKADLKPEILELERILTDNLGTRVQIEKKDQGGRVLINFFTDDDLHSLLARLQNVVLEDGQGASAVEQASLSVAEEDEVAISRQESPVAAETGEGDGVLGTSQESPVIEEEEKKDDDLYSIKNFTI